MKDIDTAELHETFCHPSGEYSVMPFWFLNGRLDKAELRRQLLDFLAHDVHGVVLHPRLGLTRDTPYMSAGYLDCIKYAVEVAAAHDMRVVLYDEAMYPSGSAHGMVVAGNPEYAARALRLIAEPWIEQQEWRPEISAEEEIIYAAAVWQKDDGSLDLVRQLPLQLEADGSYALPERPSATAGGHYLLTAIVATYSHGTIRGVHFGEDDGEPGAPAAADLLNPEAMRKFIRVTHEKYYECLQRYFGTTVIAFFTDEPSLLGRCVDEKKLKPWSKDCLADFLAAGNQPGDLLAEWYEAGPATESLRRRYRRFLNSRLEASYYEQLSDWCAAHGIALTGHPAGSMDIGCLRHFQIPGQDLVWRWVAPENDLGIMGVNSTLAKCSSDAARHLGRRRNGNECLGCCGPVDHPWDFTVADMKWYFDWLFVRGVNLLFPHAFLYSVEGEPRYNERPPDVGPNNSWWPYYGYIARYAARLSWLNTDSTNTASVAVLCEPDTLPWRIVRPLYEHQIEFNYLEDRLLTGETETQATIAAGAIDIGRQHYTVLLIEDLELLEDAALAAAVREFQAGGGQVIAVRPDSGTVPMGTEPVSYVRTADELVQRLQALGAQTGRLAPASTDIRLTHLRRADDRREYYLLTNEGESDYAGTLQLSASGSVERWDPWTGEMDAQPVTRTADGLTMRLELPRRGSVIYCIDPDGTPQLAEAVKTVRHEDIVLRDWQTELLPGETWAHPVRPDLGIGDWTEQPELHDYYGSLVYRTQVELPAADEVQGITLDLGTVGELAEILIDGERVGVSLWAPYRVNLSAALGAARRTAVLTVIVTSSYSRRYSDRVRPSGLLGPEPRLEVTYRA